MSIAGADNNEEERSAASCGGDAKSTVGFWYICGSPVSLKM